MTAEQCVRIERLARETVASGALEALIGEKVVDLAESRRCPQCGTVGIVKHGRDEEWSAAVSLPVAAWLWSHLQRVDEYAACTNAQARGLAGLCRGTQRAAVTRTGFMEHLGIARLTAWRWRHRLLTPLANGPAQMLSGIVEADETYFLRSFKGHRGWKRGNPPENRPPRYRGVGASEDFRPSVPVVTALDRAGGVVEAVLDGRREDDIVIALCGSITPGSLIGSDGLGAYPKLAELVASEHRTIEPFKPVIEGKVKLPGDAAGVVVCRRLKGGETCLDVHLWRCSGHPALTTAAWPAPRSESCREPLRFLSNSDAGASDQVKGRRPRAARGRAGSRSCSC